MRCCSPTRRSSNSKPELEIFADDVACGHGSTAGQIDEDLMFYLLARGIPEAEARALLIAAFLGEALDKIENEALRSALQEKVDDWLAGNDRGSRPSPVLLPMGERGRLNGVEANVPSPMGRGTG